jgi:hypothetical protein
VENPSDYFNGWMKMQQQAFSTLQNQMQSLYPNAPAMNDNPFANWSKTVFQAFPIGADANLAKDIFGKTLVGNDAMQKLFELWQPLLNAMRDKSVDPASYSALTDPAKIQALMNKLFQFDLDGWTKMQQQATQYVELCKQYARPWSDAAKNQTDHLMQGNFSANDFQPEMMTKRMEAMVSLFENTTGKIFGVPALGKDREKIEQLSNCAKAMSVFASNSLEYQKLMQATAMEANQELSKILVDKVAKGEKFEKFDDFFALWIDTNEKTFNKLFYTDAFSEKRNAMTDAGFNVRKLYNEIIEGQLVDLPIARRSEMDEVYKLIYDLRKQVKGLQAKLQAQE